jgi:pimeloyl-ACP methyl ester carboxylesterase
MCFARNESPLELPLTHWGNPDAALRVLLVHGFLSSAETFVELAEGMVAQGWHVTAVDLRGHGKAPQGSTYRIEDYALDLEQVTRSNGKPWDLVVAHSMGAAASSVVASRNPSWCNRLAMLDPCLYWTPTEESQVPSFVACCTNETVEDVLKSQPHWNASVVEAKIKGQRAVSERCIRETLLSNSLRDFRVYAAELDLPLFIVGSDLSKTTFDGWGSCPVKENISFIRLDGTSHNPHRDKPVEVLELIEDWARDAPVRVTRDPLQPLGKSSITCGVNYELGYRM